MNLPVPAGQIQIETNGNTRITGHARYINIGPLSIRWNSLAYYGRYPSEKPENWRPHLIDYYWNNRFVMASARHHIYIRLRGVSVLFVISPSNHISFSGGRAAWAINGIKIFQWWNLRKVWRVYREQLAAK